MQGLGLPRAIVIPVKESAKHQCGVGVSPQGTRFRVWVLGTGEVKQRLSSLLIGPVRPRPRHAPGLGCRVHAFGCRVSGFGVQVEGLEDEILNPEP